MSKEQIYYEAVKQKLMRDGVREQKAEEYMANYHLQERLDSDYLFMAHYDPRDIADEIIEREAKVYS